MGHTFSIAGLVVSVVDPQPGEVIIDCCAAPGGKTLYMASHLRGQGIIRSKEKEIENAVEFLVLQKPVKVFLYFVLNKRSINGHN